MAEISEVDIGPGAGPRNIEMRLTMREAFVIHQALRDREATLRKEAWWLGERVGEDGAAHLKQQAQECAEAADRIFRVLEGMMETWR
ncbi:hypothetical protein [Methylobacterium fujisawaense]|uniref:hypothetical protein n=1 Tax=Methylobacterium fujisawaense TaxID=107400 RepID=UPI00313DEC25